MQEPRLIPLKTMTSDIVKVSRNIPLTVQYIWSKTNILVTKFKARFNSNSVISFFLS